MTQDRITGTIRRNINLFNHLCGSNALRHVIIVTTKWSRVDREAGERRETQSKQLHWRSMIEQGTRLYQWRDDSSPKEIVHDLLKTFSGGIVLDIQKEMVDKGKSFGDTGVGKQSKSFEGAWINFVTRLFRRKY
jgi:hypothetical protein